MKKINQLMLKPQLYIFIVVVGLCLKFYGIDTTYFWFDEICTIEQTAAFPKDQGLYTLFPDNEIANIKEYTDVLHLKNHNLKLASQLKGMSKDINLNPLHYAVLAIWYRLVGDDDIHYRYFNVFILILTLPLLFQLCKLLFKSSLSGWIGISIFSILPFIQTYTHEARYNMLCIFLIVLSQYLFLKALANNKNMWWFAYVVAGILALYASLLLGLLFIANMIFVISFERKSIIKYSIASVFILMAYLPWLIEIIKLKQEITKVLSWHGWWGENQNAFTLFLGQLVFMSYAFACINEYLDLLDVFHLHQFENVTAQLIVCFLVLLLFIVAIVYTIKKAKRRTFVYLLLIPLPQMLLFLISDMIRGTASSFIHRYNILNIIGILMFVIYYLSENIRTHKIRSFVIFILLILVGIYSNIKFPNGLAGKFLNEYIETAAFVSKSESTLVITDFSTMWGAGGGIAVINECSSDNIDVLWITSDEFNFHEIDFDKYVEVYLMYASEGLTENIKHAFDEGLILENIEGISSLIRIKLHYDL